jgi:hypothetical protein
MSEASRAAGACREQDRRQLQAMAPGLVVSSRPGSVLFLVPAVDDMAPSFARGHAERRCSGACPQQTRPPRPLTPWKGRSTGCALDLDRANAAPGSYVEVPAFGPAPLAAGSSLPNPEQAGRSSFQSDHARRAAAGRGACRACYPAASGPTQRHALVAVWRGGVSPTRGGEQPGGTIRKGACLRKGVLRGAYDLRLTSRACWPAASRPGRAR